MKRAVIIPARIKSMRLPGKMLLPIGDKPLIIRTMLQVLELSDYVDIYVACCGKEIAHVVETYGGKAIVTDPSLKNGTERTYAAMQEIERIYGKKYDYIVNVQGDMPFVSKDLILKVFKILEENPDTDLATIATKVTNYNIVNNNSKVKIAATHISENLYKALYFSRSPIPYMADTYYQHIGIYGYTPKSLTNYFMTPAIELEKIEMLEQMRFLAYGGIVKFSLVDDVPPHSVDTHEDYQVAQLIYENLNCVTIDC